MCCSGACRDWSRRARCRTSSCPRVRRRCPACWRPPCDSPPRPIWARPPARRGRGCWTPRARTSAPRGARSVGSRDAEKVFITPDGLRATLALAEVALLHACEDLVAGGVPDLLIEDLDFDRARVAGGVDGLAQAAQLDHAIAHHASAEEVIRRRHQPVREVQAEDPGARASNLRIHLGVPPDVVDV